MLVAPEWRNSLELKWHELNLAAARQHEQQGDGHTTANGQPEASTAGAGAKQAAAALEAFLGLPFTDVLDESDEILRHK